MAEPTAKTLQVIQVVFNRGKGKDKSDPVRNVVAYFDFEGCFLAEYDQWQEEQNRKLKGGM